MIYHNQLRVKTAQEYQKVRTTYKLLIRDRVQVIADHNYAPLWHVLALEKCAEWCDQQYFPDFNKTSATNDDLMSGWDHDVWSSCFSGCNMGFRVNPNGTKQEACEAACIGDEDAELVGGARPGMEKQAKDPYFVSCSEQPPCQQPHGERPSFLTQPPSRVRAVPKGGVRQVHDVRGHPQAQEGGKGEGGHSARC